jgi:cell division protein FtsW (lipid II flippase)
MLSSLRLIVGVVALLMLLAGLAVLAAGGAQRLSGLWLMVLGAAGLIAVAFERMRYGSEAAERSGVAPGEAGIDTGPLEPRFHVTDERFVDPTTRRRVRVWVDPETGERRYRPDA